MHFKHFNKYDEILAKSNPEVTLLQHTQDCLNLFEKIFKWNNELINKICLKNNLDKNLITKRLFLTIAFHDIGKANEKFQAKVRQEQFDGIESHPLLSVPFIYYITKDEPLIKIKNNNFYPETLTIASHHSKLHNLLFENYQNMKIHYASEDYFDLFFKLINDCAYTNNVPLWVNLKFESIMINSINPQNLLNDEILNPLPNFKYNSEQIRSIFILFKSVLHYADWLASSGNINYKYSTIENFDSITKKMQLRVPEFEGWQDFQNRASSCSNNIFIQIPTGQGKTEAAILWGVKQNKDQKIIFLLPTMVTTNKMYNRLLNFFDGVENVGLSHGTAQYVLKDKHQDIESKELRSNYLYNRTFFKPITVATIDQLIYSFFNWGYWVLTGSASFNAKIIIDEIHIYDAYTFGLIISILELISHYNSQFSIMSASLPQILMKEIEAILPEFELIVEPNYDEKQRHIIQTYDGYIEEKAGDILADYYENKKVLVVCNTIKKARELYQQLKGSVKNDDIMLYHSQFILEDKIKKEDMLDGIRNFKNGFVAICTQIVEVSLDIDFDVLYTENAPIDAIIQRLGRVNRKGLIKLRFPEIEFSKVIITLHSDHSKKYVYKDLSLVLEKTFELIKVYESKFNGNIVEKHFKEIVDSVYIKENLGEQYFITLKEAKELIHKLWIDCTKNIYTLNSEEKFLQKISSRKSDYITVDCVLQVHNIHIDFENLIEMKKFDDLRKYILKVPIHIARNNDYFIKVLNNSDIYLLRMYYNSIEGLNLKIDDQNMN